MIRKITDLWPNLFGDRDSQKSEEEPNDEEAEEYKKVLA